MRASYKDKASVGLLVESLASRKLSAETIESLVNLNSKINSEAKLKAISKLKDNAPLFVITGQQVGMFGGPLLTLYKALGAIKAAKLLSAKLQRDVLPLFWLQSEDHDLLEIASCTVLSDNGEPTRLELNSDTVKLNRKSVSEVLLDEDILPVVSELKLNLAKYPHAENLLKSVEQSYLPGNSWNTAFLSLFADLFKDTELLFFDLNDSALKQTVLVKELFRKSIVDFAKIESTTSQSTTEQSITGGVTIKSGSPLCFVEDGNGDRYRLTLAQDGKFLAGGNLSLTKQQLLELVDNEPLRFSTSALLRPIVQDSLFPTLAYVGGDAELQYHRQLDAVYSEFLLTPPLLLSRGKFRLLGRKTKLIVDDLGLDLNAYSLSDEKVGELLRKQGHQFGIDSNLILIETSNEIEKLALRFQKLVQDIDPTLEEPLKKSSAAAINAFSQFISKLSKASIQKDSVILNRINKIRNLIYPFGTEQERELGLISILARTGQGLLAKLEENYGDFDGKVQTVVIEEL